MKKALKIIGIILGVVVLLIGGVLLYFHIKGIPEFEVVIPGELKDLKVEITPERIEHGSKLVAITCAECHMGESRKLTGKHMDEVPKEFGFIHSANITQHKERGIGAWTDGELVYFLRTGVKPSGEFVPPYMPTLARWSDEDLHSVIAFLRSDEAMVQADDALAASTRPTLLVKILSNLVFKPFEYPDYVIHRPDTTDEVATGKYIANDLLECFSCHSKDFKTNDAVNPEKSPGYYGGGNPMYDLDGNVIYSANITMSENGIAHYSKAEFIQAVKWGKKPDGTATRYPMSPRTTLSDFEVGAIYEFLKTVPHIDVPVEQTIAKAE